MNNTKIYLKVPLNVLLDYDSHLARKTLNGHFEMLAGMHFTRIVEDGLFSSLKTFFLHINMDTSKSMVVLNMH